MGFGQSINTFITPFMPTPMTFGVNSPWGIGTLSKKDDEEIKRKSEDEKEAAEFAKRLEKYKQDAIKAEEEYKNAPLTKSEKTALKKQGLNFEAHEIEKSEGSLAASMLFTTPFLLPTIKSALTSKKKTINMFYKDGAAHIDLFKKNPDLMINAQETMQKLERKYLKDLKAVKGDMSKTRKLIDERNFFRNEMQKALNSNSQQEIAKITEQCNTAKGVKNGIFSRLWRRFRNKPLMNSRYDAVMTADNAGKFASVKPPKEGVSFFKSLFSSKLTGIMTLGMAAIPVILDWGNIQKARAIDKENEQKGQNTDFAKKQILQTGTKSLSTAVTYTVMDTLGRTLTKKFLGKFAAKIATKVALKGGCKILGTALGSIIPGLGTVAGLLLGTVADYALNKFVFGNLDYFKNTGATEAQLTNATDEELINKIGEQYSLGKDIKDKNVLAILKQKCGEENFNNLKRMHNMTEKERNTYLEKIQKEQTLASTSTV